jgi:hypothetical protein
VPDLPQSAPHFAPQWSLVAYFASHLLDFLPHYCQIFENMTAKPINLQFQRQKNVKLHQIINSPVVFWQFWSENWLTFIKKCIKNKINKVATRTNIFAK